ncbi:MFS transporter [Sphingomonas sp. Leaf16]|nr:MFS transporter [Sphingomonas sp. Leaf16]KQN12506.1 MFS transporter [Sphingomonas sp. Leaf29]KQN18986.1 MFS transporter [Sphingomonas sp. Leaf32]
MVRASAPVGLVHFALAMGGFAIGTTEYATMSLLPFFSAGLRVDEPMAGHVISAYALGVVAGAPLLAVIGSRFSRRHVLIALMLLFALGNLLSAVTPTFPWMLFFRFVSGLPHGAYFGTASLVAASLVPVNKRTQAVARVMLGLTVATIVGVPLANLLGQTLGWRWGFGIVGMIAAATAIAIALVAPHDVADRTARPLAELQILRDRRIWLTLAIGAIGYGGLFSVYTYLASTLIAVTRVPETTVPVVLAIFGIGMTLGNLIVPRFADRALMPTAAALLIWSAVMLALYSVAAGALWSIALTVFAIGLGGGLGTVLQTRLMDLAEGGQSLAAALNHSAFNFANALGPWAGGLAISAGLGWTATGWVGSLFAIAGLGLWAIANRQDRASVVARRCAHE